MITNRCLERDEMERYLHGWSDESASGFAERHLAECPECERTIGELESETEIGLPLKADLASQKCENSKSDR